MDDLLKRAASAIETGLLVSTEAREARTQARTAAAQLRGTLNWVRGALSFVCLGWKWLIGALHFRKILRVYRSIDRNEVQYSPLCYQLDQASLRCGKGLLQPFCSELSRSGTREKGFQVFRHA